MWGERLRRVVVVAAEARLSRGYATKWEKIAGEAERIVGHPLSTVRSNLQRLMSDELAPHLRKLVGSGHPILGIAKSLLCVGTNNSQAWALLILLMSKAVGNAPTHHQRTFAEITVLIRTGHLVHKSLVDSKSDHLAAFGNKIALLTGDCLVAKAIEMVTEMRDQRLYMLVASALRDLTESEFVGESAPGDSRERIVDVDLDAKVKSMIENGRETEPLDSNDCMGDPVGEWTARNILDGASLLGRGCEGALRLGGHDDALQRKAYKFGCHVALAWRAASDAESFRSDCGRTFSSVSLNDDPSLYDEMRRDASAIHKTTALYYQYCMAAVRDIEDFPNNDATVALRKLIFFTDDD